MRRKIFTVLFVLATTIETMFAVTIDGIAYILNYEKSTATVTSGVKYSGNIVIPFFVEYNDKAYTVMGIGNGAFEGCKKLTSVEIPNAVTDIGGYAFSGCDKLVTVTFKYGYNITKIGERAFENCTSLTSIAIPNSVTSIGNWAFDGCSGLTSVTIPNSVTSIGRGAFYGCSGLTSVTIPNSVTSIRDHAFFNCSSLQSVIIGSNVTSIGEDAFGGCTSLTSVNWNATNFPSLDYSISADEAPFYNIRTQITSFTFGRKVKTIPRYICYGMANLTAVTIPQGVTSIYGGAFTGCDKLTSIVWNAKNCNAYNFGSQVESFSFGNSVEVIPDGLCSGMSKLTSIEIPDGVTSIGDGAFSGCTGLTSPVYNKHIFAYMPSSYSGAYAIPDGIESIAGSAFSGCTSLISITMPNSVTSIGDGAFYGCTSLTTISIPNSVQSIGRDAFHDCTSLTSITIPNSVQSIGRDAFNNCNNLKSVYISDIAAWCNISISGYDANPLYYAHNLYLNGELITNLKIPDGTTQVGTYAFYGYTGLTSVEIPSSVTSIGDWAFDGCSGLTSVTIPNNVTSIGMGAFYGCSGLTSVTIPNSVTSIGDWAFDGCSGLTSVTIPNSVTSIGYDAFENVYNIVYSGTATGSPWGAKYINKIVDGLFIYNDEDKTHLIKCHSSAARTITIPSSVSYIEKDAFANCANIDTVIWNAVFCDDFEYSPFYSSRNNLKAFIVSDGVQRIPANLCRGLQCMQNFKIPSTVAYIGKDAFNKSNLNEISIPNTIEYVGERAFGNCPLTKVHWDVANQSDYAVIGEDNGCITVSLDASNLDWDQVYLHAWTHYERILDAWPGKQIQKDENGRYSYTFPASYSYVNIIWNNGSDQTVDITNVTSSTIYTLTSSRGTSIGYTTRELEGNLDAPFYGSTDDILQFTFGNNVSRVPAQLCRDMKNITTVELPAKLSTIGKAAFKNCSKLESITLYENITEYGDEAFSGCNSLTSIYNYRERPAKLGTNTFADVDYFNCTLYVLAGSVDMYKSSGSDWKDFYFVEPIGAASIITEDIQITPSENTAKIIWPEVSGAATYELVIKDKSGNVICTLNFNAQGKLSSIAFSAPARGEAPQQTQDAGFSFTVTGLEQGTGYDMTMTAKNSSGGILKTKTISFYTSGAQGIEDVHENKSQSNKLLRDGQIFIIRDGKIYTLQGQEVK